ncbi:response regulator transcription factor [Cohnella sp. AR92]|uniref:LuxR C-terminal-related transcriptional regulator n=1 Tax=Cohnella sp. AR92 TaxID=648716 RepID=UPI000F8DF5B1|nr:response regulator transcription factor [Cohnella sp. AR92]RUS47819.1 response regulator transcription factor [Cohnella sp. AR92]
MKNQILVVEAGNSYTLQNEPDLEVAAIVDGSKAVEYIRRHLVQLVLLDLSSSAPNGLANIKAIRRVAPRLPILAVSSRYDEESFVQCLAYGVNGYLVEEPHSAGLPQMIRDILKGQHVYPDKVAALLSRFLRRQLDGMAPELSLPPQWENQLSPREKQILALVAQRLSNHEIAETLSLSEGTVKNHLTVIFGKIEVKNRREAIRALAQTSSESQYSTIR